MRLIDADRLLEILKNNYAIYSSKIRGSYLDGVHDGIKLAILYVIGATTIEGRKHGHWKFVANMLPYHICSVCGSRALFDENSYDTVMSNYCPYCGAIMDEEV